MGVISIVPLTLFVARYDPDGTTHLMLENVGCSNGIGWSPDNKIMCARSNIYRSLQTRF